MPRALHQTTLSDRPIAGGRRIELSFRADGRDSVPAILLLPDVEERSPGALLLHGYSSRKEDMASGVGAPLLARGVATLSIDLPLHGSRTDRVDAQAQRNPLAIAGLWRTALGDAALALHYLRARAELDPRRLALAGYSLGSFLGVAVAAREPAVRAVVLAAGGDLPTGTPFTALARAVADPLRAVRQLEGRPLLMVNGRSDRTVRPDQAERLFAAAREPKTIRWWDAGHLLPHAAIAEAADWLAAQFGALARRSA